MRIPDKYSLMELYHNRNFSVKVIADTLNCSENKINYWFKKYGIRKRSISEAIYLKRNPAGDPFKKKELKTSEDFLLYGLGLGLYWGEGTKSNKLSVRLGNTNPLIIKTFLKFLYEIYAVDKNKLKFGLQVFNDMDPKKAKEFWITELQTTSDKFQKVIVSSPVGNGTYKNKTKYGVLTVYLHNKKLRDILCSEVEKIK